MSTPYVVSSDLVSAYPAKSLDIAQFIDGYKTTLNMEQNAQTGTTYTLALTDFTKLVTLSNASPVAVTLPLESSVAWPTGTQLRLLNQGAGTVTVAGAVGVTINGSPLTLTQYKGANLIKTGTDVWTFIPFASGVGAAVFSDTPTGTYTGYAYKTFSASGTLNVTTAGFADLVIVPGGGGGGTGNSVGTGGGGGGSPLVITDAYLPVGTLTVTVGAGGAAATQPGEAGNTGIASRVSSYYSPGGGGGGGYGFGQNGGCGGGGGYTASGTAGGAGAIGFAGGTGSQSAPQYGGGGGGGGTAVGANGSSSNAGAGGAGSTTTIAGTTPTGAYVAGSYAFSGGGGGGAVDDANSGAGGSGGGGRGNGTSAPVSGTANTGGGGGGRGRNGAAGAGGSGIVIVRVAV